MLWSFILPHGQAVRVPGKYIQVIARNIGLGLRESSEQEVEIISKKLLIPLG